MNQFQNIQELIIEQTQHLTDLVFCNVVNVIAYGNTSDIDEVNNFVTNFYKDNGLTKIIANIEYDNAFQPMFLKTSLSQRDIVENIRLALLNASFHRLRLQAIEKNKLSIEKNNFSIEKNRLTVKKNFLKGELIKLYETLHRNEEYFNGKQEDEQFLEKIREF